MFSEAAWFVWFSKLWVVGGLAWGLILDRVAEPEGSAPYLGCLFFIGCAFVLDDGG